MALKDFSGYKVIDLEFLRTVGMPGMPTHRAVRGYELVHPHKADPKIQGVRSSAWGSVSGLTLLAPSFF